MNTRRLKMFYWLYIVFIPCISTYDCEEICRVTLKIMENTPVERLRWNLIDLLSNRTILSNYFQYSLSTPSDYFEIESSILKFRLKEFDRERICKNILSNDQCSLELQIFTQTSFIIIFQLIILDENDWRPLFPQDYIHLNIRENLPINYRVQLPIALDYDSMKYNIDYYEFVNHTEEMERIFQLEKSDEELRLKVLQKFDCERRNNYQLFIMAMDKGGWQSNILHVNITVGDLNEYQPRFTRRFYHTRIPENLPVINSSSSPILQIIATDDDCDDQIIHYSIINHEIPYDLFPFIIDKYTGVLRVQYPLDYETISTYRFRVKASNLDQITSSIVPIIIDILDINDNQPFIQMNILHEYKFNENEENLMININENIRLGQVIGTVLIRDIDSVMINHRLSLTILSCLPLTIACPIELDSGMGNSTLSPTTYLIQTSRLLDSELGDVKFIIILEARDYGQPSLSSQYRLIVNIMDENDCAPKFTQVNYQFRVSNSSQKGSLIGEVHAIDEDYSPNFRRMQYQFLENDDQDMIRIDSNNGSLFLMKQPSVGIESNITIIAIDQQNHSLYDQANIQILFYDDTICLPNFSQAIYVFNTTEHQLTPYEIGQVHVTGCFFSSISISYRLTEKDSSLPFSLNTNTGVIKVIQELDRERKSFYKFDVTVFNSTTRTEIQINILDKNDHSPIFDDPHEQYIYISTRDQNNQLFLTTIHATDEDVDFNGLVNYYFINKDLYTYFHLYSNGSIILYNPIHVYLPIRLEIYARDHGSPKALNSTENIVIYVCDIFKRNECSPNKLRRNVYLGSIFIMISIVLCLLMIILCVFWNLFIKEQLRRKEKDRLYHRRSEARKNLNVSDRLYNSSPVMNGSHRLKIDFSLSGGFFLC